LQDINFTVILISGPFKVLCQFLSVCWVLPFSQTAKVIWLCHAQQRHHYPSPNLRCSCNETPLQYCY